MISNYLKEYFKENGITQQEVENKTGIERPKVNLSLNGKRKLTADELIKIAIVFDLDLKEIKDVKYKENANEITFKENDNILKLYCENIKGELCQR